MICSCANTTNTIKEKDAITIARKQLVIARPGLTIIASVGGNNFVSAGPTSGGGPKWVIGFETIDKTTRRHSIYYVTVFPDGRTGPHEIREGAIQGNAVDVSPLDARKVR